MAVTTPKLTFHFPIAASPDKIPVLLQVLADCEEPIFQATVLNDLAFERSTSKNRFDEARVLAVQDLKVITVSKEEGIQLTPSAKVILKKRDAVQFDLLHYLFYAAWNQQQPTQSPRSWLYRWFCNYLWNMQNLNLNNDMKHVLTQQLDNQARLDFESVPGFVSEKFSLGRQSLAGLLEWLCYLQPSVLEGEEFHRRSACSAELFLLSLSRSYALSDATVGMDLLLSPQRRDEICQLCLLDPLQFDRMLDWVLPIYPQFVAQGTRSGSYGRFVRLHRLVNVEDLG